VNLVAICLALGAILFWSSNAVVAKYALQGLEVQQIQCLQFAGASLVFALTCRHGSLGFSFRRMHRDRAALGALSLGVIGLVGTMVFQYLAFAAGPIAQVNLIAYTWPLIATLMIIALGEARRPAVLLAISLVGFTGAAMIMDGGNLSWSSWGFEEVPWGYLAAIASALCMAAYTVGVGRVTATPSALLLPASLVGLAGTFLWTLWAGADWPLSHHLLLGFYLGAGPMGAGYLLWSLALKRQSAGIIANLGYAAPLVSTMFLLVSGEKLTGTAFAGGLLVVASCVLISRKKQSNSRRELANAR